MGHGFAMLGMGSGAMLVALSERLRRAPLDRVCAMSCLAAAVCIGAGYFLVALVPFDPISALYSEAALPPLAVAMAMPAVSRLELGPNDRTWLGQGSSAG